MSASRSDGPSPSLSGVKVDLASRRRPIRRRTLNIGGLSPFSPRKVVRAVNSSDIADTLEAAITALRAPVDLNDPRRSVRCEEVANDLALLHGYVVAVQGDRGHRFTASPPRGRWPLLRRRSTR